MKPRCVVVVAVAAAALGLGAAPASACQPEYCPPCGYEPVDTFWEKRFGEPLFHCPW